MSLQIGSHFVLHICINSSPPSAAYIYGPVNWVSIVSDNGLSPVKCLAIIWPNAGLLSIGPLGTNFSGIGIKLHNFLFI